MSGCPHTNFKKNAWIFVIFKDGTKLKTKWLPGARAGRMKTTDGEFKISKIRSAGIWRTPFVSREK